MTIPVRTLSDTADTHLSDHNVLRFADPPHSGKLAAALGLGDPGELMALCQTAGVIAPTDTNVSTTVARCSSFVLPFDLTVNRIRYYMVGASANFRVAIYRLSTLARLTAALTMGGAANAFSSVNAGPITLSAGVPYFIACAAVAASAVAGPLAFGTTTTATTGQINIAPGSLIGNMLLSSGFLNHYQFQFAVTAGALPDPAAALVAPAAWTGGMPAFWLDNDATP